MTFNRLFYCAVCALVAFGGSALQGTSLQTEWPLDRPSRQQINEEKLEDLLTYVFPDQPPSKPGRPRRGIRSDGLVIIKNGFLVYERYANGFSHRSKHYLWSVSKTVFSLILGAAEKQNYLSRNDRLSKFISDLPADKKDMTIMDLLFWTSGIRWQETYEFAPLYSDVVAMLYTAGFEDMGAYVLNLPMRYRPGERFAYSSGDTNLLATIFRKALPHQKSFVKTFFSTLGIEDYTFETDSSGNLVAASALYLTPRDLARVGLLALRQGRWGSKQILPEDWMKTVTRPSSAFLKSEAYKNRDESYGAGHWWINYLGPDVKAPLRWSAAPPDTFMAMGHWGQYLVVIPSLDLVVVRTGDDRESKVFDRNEFLKRLVLSVTSS